MVLMMLLRWIAGYLEVRRGAAHAFACCIRCVMMMLVIGCAGFAQAQQGSNLTLSAVLTATGGPIRSGLHWRIYKDQINADGSVDMVAESSEAMPSFTLDDGNYMVHVGFGLAVGNKSIQIRARPVTEKIMLNAGGMTISPTLGGAKLTANKVSMSIFVPEKTIPRPNLSWRMPSRIS